MCDVQTSLYEAKLPEFCHPKLTRVCKIATYNFRTLALKEQWPHILLGISWPLCNKPLVLFNDLLERQEQTGSSVFMTTVKTTTK